MTSKKIRKRFSKTFRFMPVMVWIGKYGKCVKTTNQGSWVFCIGNKNIGALGDLKQMRRRSLVSVIHHYIPAINEETSGI